MSDKEVILPDIGRPIAEMVLLEWMTLNEVASVYGIIRLHAEELLRRFCLDANPELYHSCDDLDALRENAAGFGLSVR